MNLITIMLAALLPTILSAQSAAPFCVQFNQAGTYAGSGLSLSGGTYTTSLSGSILTLNFRLGKFQFSGVKAVPCAPVVVPAVPPNSIVITLDPVANIATTDCSGISGMVCPTPQPITPLPAGQKLGMNFWWWAP